MQLADTVPLRPLFAERKIENAVGRSFLPIIELANVTYFLFFLN